MSIKLNRALAAGLSAAALMALPGCVSLLPESEPNALYRLSDAPAAQAELSEGAQTLIVNRIAAPRGLAGDRIAIEREGRIAYMAGAAWLSPAPVMLQARVMDAFHADVPAITPARTEDGVSARYTLDLELRHFEAVYDAGAGSAPLVRVALRARMIDRDTRALIATRSIDASRRAGANRQGAIVDAFSAASGQAADQLAGWAEGLICQSEDAPAACGR